MRACVGDKASSSVFFDGLGAVVVNGESPFARSRHNYGSGSGSNSNSKSNDGDSSSSSSNSMNFYMTGEAFAALLNEHFPYPLSKGNLQPCSSNAGSSLLL